MRQSQLIKFFQRFAQRAAIKMDKDNQDFVTGSGWGPRTRPAVLHVRGPDALAFLQGQFTQELRPKLAPPVQYGLWLNQKGRVLGDSHVVRVTEEEWWLVSEETPAEVLRERLEAYIIADDVTVEDRSAEWGQWTGFGVGAGSWLESRGAGVSKKGEWQRLGSGIVYADARGERGGWKLLLPHTAADAPPTTLTPEETERARIAAGIPAVPRDVGPSDLPAEAGLETTAISFTKGCYLGQEVVARLQAMGRVRRSLMRVKVDEGRAPTVGMALVQSGKKVGEVRSAVSVGAGWWGLAMVTLLQLQPGAEVESEDLACGRGTLEPLER